MNELETIRLLEKENRRLRKKLERSLEELQAADEVKERYEIFSNRLMQEVRDSNAKLAAALDDLTRSNQQLQVLAMTDPLTTLYNRNYFNTVFEREVMRAKRSSRMVALVMTDVDCFKQYNDTYGHQAGDEALAAIGEVLKNIVKRSSDFVFRLGGEEFGFLLCDTREDDPIRVAEAVRESISSLKIAHVNNSAGPCITASFGVAARNGAEIEAPAALYRLADQALYSAKHQGRNRVVPA